jgi:tryptophan 7-halogenase
MRSIRQLAFVGQGLWLQMAAALACRQLKPFGVQCTAIEMPDLQRESRSVVCGPELQSVCQMLGLNILEILRQASGTFSLGRNYSDPANSDARSPSPEWFVPYGGFGLSLNGAEFEQGLFSYLATGPEQQLEPYCLAAHAARHGKFALAPQSRPDLKALLEFGLHLDSHAFTALLRRYNQQQGIVFVQSETLRVQQTAEGLIQHLELDDGQTQPLDFVIDCRPAAQADSAACRIQLSAEAPCSELNRPYTSVERTPWGWLVTHPLQGKNVWHTEFSPSLHRQEQVTEWLKKRLAKPDWKTRHRRQQVPQQLWQANSLKLGLAAEALDSPMLDDLGALQYLLIRWLDLLPNQTLCPATARMFNQHWQQYCGEVLDYLKSHQAPLETESGRLFSRLGRLPRQETDAIRNVQRMALLYGLGIRPQLPGRLLACNSPTEIAGAMEKIRYHLNNLVVGMPEHQQTLSRCMAEPITYR